MINIIKLIKEFIVKRKCKCLEVSPKETVSLIKHLEEQSQKELIVLTDLIKKHVSNCSMIILFGSYAKGTAVIYDEYYVDGVRTSYQSDFDIMVVLPPLSEAKMHGVERRLNDIVTREYDKNFSDELHAPPQFIVETASRLAKNLRRKQPFFTDIITEGIVLYDNGEVVLPEPQELSFAEKKEIAQNQFNQCIDYADEFLDGGRFYLGRDKFGMGAFQAHQACENYYRAMGIVFDNYNPKLHDLEKFIAKTKSYSRDLATVFPRNTDFEKSTFKLLYEAYIRARYNVKYVVTKEELEYMLKRIEVLKEMAHRLCKERLEYYDKKAREQEITI